MYGDAFFSDNGLKFLEILADSGVAGVVLTGHMVGMMLEGGWRRRC